MEVAFDEEALKDLKIWKQSGNTIIQKKITKLLNAITTDPFKGIGKPEALKHQLSGSWSRRISDEHRIVYTVTKNIIQIHSLRGHYSGK